MGTYIHVKSIGRSVLMFWKILTDLPEQWVNCGVQKMNKQKKTLNIIIMIIIYQY